MDLECAAQQPELAQFAPPIEHPVYSRNLDIVNSPAADAYDMMVWRCIAVVAGAVVERGNLARFPNPAQGFERPMDGGERDVRMLAAHRGINCLGAWVVGGGEQCANNREALRSYRQATAMASLGEFSHPSGRVIGAPFIVYHLHFHRR